MKIGSTQSRTTNLLLGNQLLASLRRTQRALQKVQQQVSTGRRIERPSDEPARTSTILFLESAIQARAQHEMNLQRALGVLNTTDQALGDASDLLLEAQSIASSQVGLGSDAATRANQSIIIDAQIQAMIDLANRQFQGVSIFGGNRSAARNQPVFEEFLGGVRYIGSTTNLFGDLGGRMPLEINSNGQDGFGALSSRVLSTVDYDPRATANTRIADVGGAQGVPVRLGTVRVTVDATEVAVDLKTADTLGDVVTRIQDAIDNVTGGGAGLIEIFGSGFRLTAAVGQTITIEESGFGQIAADLGIALGSTGGVPTVGADLNALLTSSTELSALTLPIDFAGGMKITQGAVTKVADFSAATTIEDVINVIDQLNLGLRMEINESRTALNLVSEVSGLGLSISENGGVTAEDLDLRTFGNQTGLADLRFGLGVESILGEDDFIIELHDGRTFNVNIDGLATVQDLIGAITAAASAAGLTVGAPGAGGTDFNAGLAPNASGFQFEDNTAGSGSFRVRQLVTSLAATHLGIYKDVGAGSQIVGDDVSRVRAESIFTHLIDLRDSLLKDDFLGITLAGGAIEKDVENLARDRADVGTRAQRIALQQERSQGLMISDRTFLSELQDTDLTEAVTRILQLQQQLQASLNVGASNLQLSLLDFLR